MSYFSLFQPRVVYLRAAVFFLALGAMVATWPSPVSADQTRVDATVSSYNFTSTHQYGPWTIEDVRFSHSKEHQTLNFELSHRSDSDGFMPTSGTFGAVGYTADITNRLFGFAQVGFGSSLPFPSNTEHVELDYKASPDKSIVLSAAEEWAHYGTGPSSRETIIGPSVYMRHGVFQARALIQSNTGVSTQTGGLISYDYIPTSRDKVSAAVMFGPQAYETIVPNVPIAYAKLNGTTGTVSYQRLLTQSGGITLGLTYGHIRDLNTGEMLYVQRGFTLGYFVRH